MPSSWHPQSTNPAAVEPEAQRWSRARSLLKPALVIAIASLTLLDRFGLRLSAEYAIHPALFATYALVAVMLLTGSARINHGAALLYVTVVTVAVVSFVVNSSLPLRQYASIGSLMLVVVLYAPLTLSLRPEVGTAEMWRWLMKVYIGLAVTLGAIGIVQFYAQFVFTAPWLFDYRPFIPEAIRGSGFYNTTNPLGPQAGASIKANGFFIREASMFSFFMAFGMIAEWSLARRKWVIGVMAFALVLSYSGSGLLALGVAMLFPLGSKTLLRLVAAGVVGATFFLLFGDALNLDYTLNRIDEFQVRDAANSSAYCRFIAPAKVVVEHIDSAPWTAYLGHGPGTMQKMYDTCETAFGKVVIEYGLLGAVAFAALVLAAINRPAAPIRLRVALLVNWMLLGGQLVSPDCLLTIFLFAAVWDKGLLARLSTPAPAMTAILKDSVPKGRLG